MLLECIVDAHILKDNSLSEQPLGSIVDTGGTAGNESVHQLTSVEVCPSYFPIPATVLTRAPIMRLCRFSFLFVFSLTVASEC